MPAAGIGKAHAQPGPHAGKRPRPLILKDKFGHHPDGFINISSPARTASYAGTTYETVFRIVTELTRAGGTHR